jgi:hypothetical protein
VYTVEAIYWEVPKRVLPTRFPFWSGAKPRVRRGRKDLRPLLLSHLHYLPALPLTFYVQTCYSMYTYVRSMCLTQPLSTAYLLILGISSVHTLFVSLRSNLTSCLFASSDHQSRYNYPYAFFCLHLLFIEFNNTSSERLDRIRSPQL